MAYIGRQLARGENKLFDDISSSFNGSTTTFTLAVSSVATATATPYQLFVSLGGVMQKPNTDFTTAGNQITFTTAPAAGLSCWIMMQGDAIDNAAVADASITPSKISGSNFAFSGDLRLKDADGSHYVGFASPSTVSSNKVWTLPAADGSASQYLQTNGSGVLTWSTVSIGGATGIDFNDNVKTRWGTGNDLEIFHNSSNSVINDAGTGDLLLQVGGSTKATVSSTGLAITGALTVSTNATITGNLTVSGTTTTINTQTLDVEDKNVVIGKVSNPSDTTADGGGITLKGASDKTINWVNSTDAWTFSEHINIASGKKLGVGGANYGTSGQVLTSGGSSTHPSWTTISTAPTITGTMSGSVAQDKPVQIKSDGTLEAVSQVNAGVGTAAEIATGNTGGDTWDLTNRTVPLGGGKFATVYINDNHYPVALITEVNAATFGVTKGTEVALETSGDHCNFPSIAYDHTNSRIVYSYCYGNSLWAKVATFSGTTLTFGSRIEVAGNASHADSCFEAGSGCVVWAFEWGNVVKAISATTTSSRGLTVSGTVANVTDSNISNGQQPTIVPIHMQGCYERVGIAFRYSSDVWYKPMVISSNVVSSQGNNAVEVFTATGDTDIGLGYARTQWQPGNNGTGTYALFSVAADNGRGWCRTAIIGGNGHITNMYGSVTPLNSNSNIGNTHLPKHLPYDRNLGKFIITSKYSPASGSDYFAYQAVAPDLTLAWDPVCGTAIQLHSSTDAQESCVATTQIMGTDNSGNPIDPVTADERMYAVFRDNADSDKIKHLGFLTLSQSNITTKVIGFADAAYTNGQTATIKINSNTTTQSSLTPGTKYYVQGDASLGTSAHSQATVIAGIALTSTTLLIENGGF